MTIYTYIAQMLQGYIECMLWSSIRCDEEGNNCTPLDEDYGPDDVAPEALREAKRDCIDFLRQCRDAAVALPGLVAGDLAELHGMDLWLTRNHHGAGFGDRGYGPLGTHLTDIAQHMGSRDAYVGGDEKVHVK